MMRGTHDPFRDLEDSQQRGYVAQLLKRPDTPDNRRLVDLLITIRLNEGAGMFYKRLDDLKGKR